MSIPPHHPLRSSLVPEHANASGPGVHSSHSSATSTAASHTTTATQTSPTHAPAHHLAAPPLTTPQAGASHQNGSSTSSSSIPAVPHVAWSPPSLLTSMASPQDYESATPRLLIVPPITPVISPPSLHTPSSSAAWMDGKGSPVAGDTPEPAGLTSPLRWLNLPPHELQQFLQTVMGPAGPHLPMQELWEVQRAGGHPQAQANAMSNGVTPNGTHHGTTHAPYAPPGLEQDFWSEDEELDIHLSTTGAATTQTTQTLQQPGAASQAGGLPTPAQSIEELVEQIAHDIGEDNPGSPGATGNQAQSGAGSAASSTSTITGPLVRTSQWNLPPHPGPDDRGSI